MVISGLEGAARDDIDTNAEEVLEILEQADVIEKRGTRLKIHEQVHIAARVSIPPGDRTEHRDTTSLRLRAMPRISPRRRRSPSMVSTSSVTSQGYRRADGLAA